MRATSLLLSAGAGLALAVAALPTSAQTLADLAFMSGCWATAPEGGARMEEFYSAPSENLMVGATRFLRGERTVMFEFARITAGNGEVWLLPFPNGTPSEHPFRLTRVGEEGAVFEAPEHDFPKRIIYRALEDGRLQARIDGGEGSEQVQSWVMSPAVCGEAAPGGE